MYYEGFSGFVSGTEVWFYSTYYTLFVGRVLDERVYAAKTGRGVSSSFSQAVEYKDPRFPDKKFLCVLETSNLYLSEGAALIAMIYES